MKLFQFTLRDFFWLMSISAVSLCWMLSMDNERQLKERIVSLKKDNETLVEANYSLGEVAYNLYAAATRDPQAAQMLGIVLTKRLKQHQDDWHAKGLAKHPEYPVQGTKFYQFAGKIVRCVYHYGDEIVIQWEDGSADGINPLDFHEHVRGPNEDNAYYSKRLEASRRWMQAAKEWKKE